MLESSQRTGAIDRIVALDGPEAGVERLKLIVLMVLWNRGQAPHALIPDVFLASERPGALHPRRGKTAYVSLISPGVLGAATLSPILH